MSLGSGQIRVSITDRGAAVLSGGGPGHAACSEMSKLTSSPRDPEPVDFLNALRQVVHCVH